MGTRGSAAPIVVGRYAMYDRIGSGGMATVHLGRVVGEGERGAVAIKRLHAHVAEDPELFAAFRDEARLAARVKHPSVVAVVDVVSSERDLLLVMEYVEGLSLSALVRLAANAKRAVPHAVAVAIVVGALRGLHAAHEAKDDAGDRLNIVHRDVSPKNILVGIDGVAKVIDFGVAKAIGRSFTTQDGRIKGTPGYMAPEQLTARGVTRKTDVFAAGVVLWELLTGEFLFRADEPAATFTRILFHPVAPPSHVAPHAPASLDPIALRALDRDPSRRFPSAEAMADALCAALPPAPAADVAAWLSSLGQGELNARAKLCEEAFHQSQSTVPIVAGSIDDAVTIKNAAPPVKSRSRGIMIGAAIGVAALALGVASVASFGRGGAPRGTVTDLSHVAPVIAIATPVVSAEVASGKPEAPAASASAPMAPLAPLKVLPRAPLPRASSKPAAEAPPVGRTRLYGRD